MECDTGARYIRESLWIRKRGANVMNRDEGAYFKSHPYDPLLTLLDSRQTGNLMKRWVYLKKSLPMMDKTVRLVLKPTLVLLKRKLVSS